MSFHYPKRIKDLQLTFESDDDFNTPLKPPKAAKQAQFSQDNKENDQQLNLVTSLQNRSSLGRSACSKLPKRSAELPSLDSDSDENSSTNEDQFNCAILNDSFIVSPAKSDCGEHDSSADDSKQRAIRRKTVNDSLSFVAHFDKMAINAKQQQLNRRSVELNKLELLPSIQETQQAVAPAPTPQAQPHRLEFETPFKTASTDNQAPQFASHTQNEAQFVTPQVRSIVFKQRPVENCSTALKLEQQHASELQQFRSQKVLFQTPVTGSRRKPVNRVGHDSYALPLCETISESAEGTPNALDESMPEISEPRCVVAPLPKSKKSLEDAFQKQASKTIEEVAATCLQPNAANKEVLHINNASYEILQKLGSGGSSTVFLAKRMDTAQEYALKVVNLRGDPTVVQGYLNETKLLAKLQGNAAVVSLHEYQLLLKESKLFLVMEKGDSDLQHILQNYNTHLPLYELANYLHQMLQAVNYIHQNGVIHSDLKPANFLMVKNRLKLIDFGIASNIALDSTSIIKFSQAGTFNYISPEALTDTSTGTSPMRSNQPKIKISTKSDVWSLGCILYLLLYKRTPFSHIKNVYAKISAIANPKSVIEYPALQPFYPAMLMQMAKVCLQYNPKQRPSCAELLKLPFNMIIPVKSLTTPNANDDDADADNAQAT